MTMGVAVERLARNTTNVQFSVTFSAAVTRRLEEIAERRGSSRATIVRELVIAGLDRDALVQRIADAVA